MGFEFGMWATNAFTIYSIFICISTVIVGGGMLMSGAESNKIKRHYEFLRLKTNELRRRSNRETMTLILQRRTRLLQKRKFAMLITPLLTGVPANMLKVERL